MRRGKFPSENSLVPLIVPIIILSSLYHNAAAFSEKYGSIINYKSTGLQSSVALTTNQVPVNKSLKDGNLPKSVQSPDIAQTIPINPPFRICEVSPNKQAYSDMAIYRIAGTATLGKSYSNQTGLRYLGNVPQNLTIMMINNLTTPLSGQLVVNDSKSIDLQVQHISTQCGSKFNPGMNSSALRAPYPNPREQDLLLSNPPFRECATFSSTGFSESFSSALYTIKGITESQLPNDFPNGKQNITITITNNFLAGQISGNLLLNDSKSIGFSVAETATLCSNQEF
jgi:hypothetical protein